MDAKNYLFMKSLHLPVDLQYFKTEKGVLEAATRNGMHDVWYVFLNANDEFIGDARDHPIAQQISEKLRKTAHFEYDGRGQEVHVNLGGVFAPPPNQQNASSVDEFIGPPRPKHLAPTTTNESSENPGAPEIAIRRQNLTHPSRHQLRRYDP